MQRRRRHAAARTAARALRVRRRARRATARRHAEARHRNAGPASSTRRCAATSSTGLLRRAAFVEAATARAALPLKGGLRAIAYLAPDRARRRSSATTARSWPRKSWTPLGASVEAQLQPGDLAAASAPRGIAPAVRARQRARPGSLARRACCERIAAEPIARGNEKVYDHLQRGLDAAGGARRAGLQKPSHTADRGAARGRCRRR